VHISEIRRFAAALKLRFGLIKLGGDRCIRAFGFGQVFELQKQAAPAVFEAAREDVGCSALPVVALKFRLKFSCAAVFQSEVEDELQRAFVEA
jgi:hypothetical protein